MARTIDGCLRAIRALAVTMGSGGIMELCDDLEAAIAEQADEIERLRAVEARLPETADKVRVVPVPATRVFRIITAGRYKGMVQESSGWQDGHLRFDHPRDQGEQSYGHVMMNVALCYSTREAAEAVREASDT